MTILQQVLLAFAAFVLFIFAIRLVFALLLRLQLLPILVWLGVGRIYPQWAAEHPFVFYGVLAFFGLLALSCWLRPVVEWVQERQMLRLAERQIKNDLHRANAEGRTITGFQLRNPSRNMRTEKRRASARRFLIVRTSPLRCVPLP